MCENIQKKNTDPVAMRAKAYVCSRSVGGVAGSNPAEVMDVRLLCCVGSGLYDGLITRSEECVFVCACVCAAMCV